MRRFGLSLVNRASLLAVGLAVLLTGLAPHALPIGYGAGALFGAAYIMLTGVYLVWGVRLFADRPGAGSPWPS